jgi:formamidopyrimidine-DNA glycosylase
MASNPPETLLFSSSSPQVLYQSGVHPKQRANKLSKGQVTNLYDSIVYVVTTACHHAGRATKSDETRWPRHWLFHHRWTSKKATRDAFGNAVTFETVGGRTTAIVNSMQTMGKTSVPLFRRPEVAAFNSSAEGGGRGGRGGGGEEGEEEGGEKEVEAKVKAKQKGGAKRKKVKKVKEEETEEKEEKKGTAAGKRRRTKGRTAQPATGGGDLGEMGKKKKAVKAVKAGKAGKAGKAVKEEEEAGTMFRPPFAKRRRGGGGGKGGGTS